MNTRQLDPFYSETISIHNCNSGNLGYLSDRSIFGQIPRILGVAFPKKKNLLYTHTGSQIPFLNLIASGRSNGDQGYRASPVFSRPFSRRRYRPLLQDTDPLTGCAEPRYPKRTRAAIPDELNTPGLHTDMRP
eukprot:1183352-Prorocentrum_minimum.AAC.2